MPQCRTIRDFLLTHLFDFPNQGHPATIFNAGQLRAVTGFSRQYCAAIFKGNVPMTRELAEKLVAAGRGKVSHDALFDLEPKHWPNWKVKQNQGYRQERLAAKAQKTASPGPGPGAAATEGR
jgi:hypothetical protein